MKRKMMAVVTSVVLSFMMVGNAYAYSAIGQSQDVPKAGIPDKPISVSTTTAVNDAQVASIVDAMTNWNLIGMGDLYQYAGAVDASEKDVAHDGRNIVSMANLPCFQLARTIVWGASNQSRINEMDIMINQNVNFDLTNDGYDLGTIALHELGHGLGLGHSYEEIDVMYPILKPCQQRRTVNRSEREGLSYLEEMQAYSTGEVAYISGITQDLSFEQLKQDAPLIIAGIAVNKGAGQWNGNVITSDTEFMVGQVFKGDYAQEKITVTTLGGTVGDVTMICEDSSNFYMDEVTMLFLMPDGNGKYIVYGNSQGRFYQIGDDNFTNDKTYKTSMDFN